MDLNSYFIFASMYSLAVLGAAMLIMVITLKHIIPEANVKNGLIELRRLLLIDGISTLLLTSVAFVIIGARFLLNLQGYVVLSLTLLIIFSTIVFIKTIVKYKIYTLNYSPESKIMHGKEAKRVIREENKTNKK